MIRACITEEELRRALKDVEEAKAKGFTSSVAVLEAVKVGRSLSDCELGYDGGVILKGHPDDPKKNWGYCSTKQIEWYKLVDREVVEDD